MKADALYNLEVCELMEKAEIFSVLGIGENFGEQEIRAAYREKLAVTNPEDNPEGFKRLRQAYEEALALARQPQGEEEPEQEDTTETGRWVAQAAGPLQHSGGQTGSGSVAGDVFPGDLPVSGRGGGMSGKTAGFFDAAL